MLENVAFPFKNDNFVIKKEIFIFGQFYFGHAFIYLDLGFQFFFIVSERKKREDKQTNRNNNKISHK